MHRSFLSIGLAALLLLGTLSTYNFAGAQEAEDHEHAEHAAETTSEGPSINDTSLTVESVADGLILPTAMAFLDEDRMLVLEKDNGTVRMVENGEVQSEPVLDVAVANDNERGMMGIAVSQEDNGTTYVFVYFTESGGGVDGDDRNGVTPAGNRLYRYELQDDELTNPRLLFDLPALPGPRYNGGPVVIGPDDNVYVVVGDVEGHATQAQNFEDGPAPDGTSGVLRIGKNGEDPESVIGSGTFGKYYFAYGIRNSFGMAFDPETGMLWDTENGPAYGDEVNLVEEGFNSGWRDVQGVAANESQLDGLVLFNSRSHYSDPEFSWEEPVGPTALEFLSNDNNETENGNDNNETENGNGDNEAENDNNEAENDNNEAENDNNEAENDNSSGLGREYENDMFVGDINNGAIYHFDLNENRTALELEGALEDTVANTPEESQAAVFGSGFGGVTDIKSGPDGYLYVVSFIDGTIYRVVPAEDERENGNETEDENGNETEDENGNETEDENGNGNNETENGNATDTENGNNDTEDENGSSNSLINRLVRSQGGDDCLDEQDQRRMDTTIGKLIGDIFSENEDRAETLQRALDGSLEECLPGENSGNGGDPEVQGNRGLSDLLNLQ
jgi:glucose/arabinose dehydrogenase